MPQRTNILLLAMLLLGTAGCKEAVYPDTDLSFFDLNGKVKKYAELKVAIGLSSTANFDTYDTDANYLEYNFSDKGKLIKINNVNPSPYSLQGFNISFKRYKDSLTIDLNSPKEKYVKTYLKTGDTLSISEYDKVVDEQNKYFSEGYKKYISVKAGESYLMKAYFEGTDQNKIFDEHQYAVTKNKKGLDSLIYLRRKSGDPLLVYSVNYLTYDGEGNWLARQFIGKSQLQGQFTTYTIYRKIEYYEQ